MNSTQGWSGQSLWGHVSPWDPCKVQTGLLEGMFENMRAPPEVVRRGALSMTDPHRLQASQKSGPLDLGVISIHICRHRQCWKCFGTMKGAECGV